MGKGEWAGRGGGIIDQQKTQAGVDCTRMTGGRFRWHVKARAKQCRGEDGAEVGARQQRNGPASLLVCWVRVMSGSLRVE